MLRSNLGWYLSPALSMLIMGLLVPLTIGISYYYSQSSVFRSEYVDFG